MSGRERRGAVTAGAGLHTMIAEPDDWEEWGEQLWGEAIWTADSATRFAAERRDGAIKPEDLEKLAETLAEAGRKLIAAAERLRPQVREHRPPPKGDPAELARRRRERTYGISPAAQAAKWRAQGGRCARCSAEIVEFGGGAGGAALDHDHRSGRVRGYLCLRCNTRSIGLIESRAQLVTLVRMYLAQTRRGEYGAADAPATLADRRWWSDYSVQLARAAQIAQVGRCAICAADCGTDFRTGFHAIDVGRGDWVLDYDGREKPKTPFRARRLICANCNQIVDLLEEDGADELTAAYLARYTEV